MKPAERIAQLKPYFFAQLNPRLNKLRQDGVDVIRLDVGSPDRPPAPAILQKMVDCLLAENSHGYQPYGGSEQYRRAISTYYANRFGVSLDPDRECVGLIGSKEGIFNVSQALFNPGDLVLVPDPAYPTYAWGAEVAGAEIYSLPLLAENGFLPDLAAIPLSVAQRAKAIWLNYPNNPTGASAPFEYFEALLDFARQHEIFVFHDAPYLEIGFDGYRAPSLLQGDGAQDIVVEFNSLSKTYNMAGWRLGMAVGNESVIGHLHALKTKIDSSHFGPAMEAGAFALTGDQDWLIERNQRYEERRDLICAGLRAIGFEVNTPTAALYIWAKIPGDDDAYDFCQMLLEDTGVSITPGPVFGDNGVGYVRISLCTSTPKVEEAMERIVNWAGRLS